MSLIELNCNHLHSLQSSLDMETYIDNMYIVVYSIERSSIYSDRWCTDDLADGLQMGYQMRIYHTVVTINRSICLDSPKAFPVF